VIDWKRLNFADRADVEEFLRVQEFWTPTTRKDVARMEAVKREAVEYLRRNFEYPIPKPIVASRCASRTSCARPRARGTSRCAPA
jgi:uncharacterized protein (TIGR04552 family)